MTVTNYLQQQACVLTTGDREDEFDDVFEELIEDNSDEEALFGDETDHDASNDEDRREALDEVEADGDGLKDGTDEERLV